MLTLLGSLIGFFGSFAPDLLALFKQKGEFKQELAIMDMQRKANKELAGQKLEQINAEADIAETKVIYETWKTNVAWVDTLNGSVRPVLAYAFFILYATVKVLTYVELPENVDIQIIKATLWTQEDAAIFAGIISFYFGQRAMAKLRK